jgi:hypothetical protein
MPPTAQAVGQLHIAAISSAGAKERASGGKNLFSACSRVKNAQPAFSFLGTAVANSRGERSFQNLRGYQISQPTHFSNSLLRFLPFICYKQFTESRCVATPVVFV